MSRSIPPRLDRVLLAIAGVALLLRVAAIVMLQSWNDPNPMEHAAIADGLLAGHGFSFGEYGYYGPSSVQSPPYPLLLAGAFLLLGHGAAAFAAVLILNAVLGAITVYLCGALVRAMHGSNAVARLTAGLMALWPTQIYMATNAQAVTIITLAILGLVVLFDRMVRGQKIGSTIGFSAILALGVLTEPVLLPSVPMTMLLLGVWPRVRWNVRLRNIAVLLLAMAVIVGPWSVRNRMVHGRWVPVKSTFWVNFYKGNNPHATGTDRLELTDEQRRAMAQTSWLDREQLVRSQGFDQLHQLDLLSAEQRAQLSGRPETAREDLFKTWTLDWIKENPRRYAALCGLRLAKTLWIEWDNPRSRNAVYLVTRSVLVVMTLIGLPLAIGRRWRLVYPALLYASCLGIYVLTIAAARFALTFEPIQLALASLTIVTIAAPRGGAKGGV